jgi:hypothetical protein
MCEFSGMLGLGSWGLGQKDSEHFVIKYEKREKVI